MTNLIVAAVVFLLLHLVVSGTRVRDGLTSAIGEGPYLGLFSLASLAGLIWLGIAFGVARGGPGDSTYWAANTTTRVIELFIQLAAFLIAVPGIMTRNPTSVGQARSAEDADVVTGMLRISRHPFLWGAAIWAAGHLLVNGDTASLVFFGTFVVLTLAGTASIDAKRQRALGPAWNEFANKTSSVPFAAILSGRQKLNIGEIGILRIGAAVVFYVVMIGAHSHIFGASALPS
jgi:uncharacterized membrane protein